MGGHDHVCGALAIGVTEPGMILNSLGTAEAWFLPIRAPLADPQVGYQGYAQGVHVDGSHYYAMGGLYTSGVCVDWFRTAFAGDVDYATLIAEAEQALPGSLGICFLPHLRLANPPNIDPESRGAFVGLNTDANRGTLFRALLEGLAFEARNTLEPLLGYTQTPVDRIFAIGGGTRNRLLMQIKATVLNQPLQVVSMDEATALGAALLGGIGAGVYANLPAALEQVQYTQTPVAPLCDQVAMYDATLLQVHRRLYQALQPLHHAIHSIQEAYRR